MKWKKGSNKPKVHQTYTNYNIITTRTKMERRLEAKINKKQKRQQKQKNRDVKNIEWHQNPTLLKQWKIREIKVLERTTESSKKRAEKQHKWGQWGQIDWNEHFIAEIQKPTEEFNAHLISCVCQICMVLKRHTFIAYDINAKDHFIYIMHENKSRKNFFKKRKILKMPWLNWISLSRFMNKYVLKKMVFRTKFHNTIREPKKSSSTCVVSKRDMR